MGRRQTPKFPSWYSFRENIRRVPNPKARPNTHLGARIKLEGETWGQRDGLWYGLVWNGHVVVEDRQVRVFDRLLEEIALKEHPLPTELSFPRVFACPFNTILQ